MPGMTVNRVRVLVSSRNSEYETEAGGKFDLKALRQALKQEIEDARLFGEQIFDCWVNETEPTKSAARDLWDECVAEVRRAHVVLVLYNGDAGWTSNDEGIGICQAELQAAVACGPGADTRYPVAARPCEEEAPRRLSQAGGTGTTLHRHAFNERE